MATSASNRETINMGVQPAGSALVKVKKSGVYRNKAGHAMYLNKDSDVPKVVLEDYSFDADGTKERDQAPERERSFFGAVHDAGQDDFVAERARADAERQTKEGRGGDQNKSDAQLAAEADTNATAPAAPATDDGGK